ncbi:hypothetical protein LCGC14_1994890 [marine sediment metagenome]|uniref:Uncharacterized protein n=1 Tax=marine sediment metagenome TaxID=412755 RepID=A0A0F9FSZ9_9ZZZZ
MLDRVYSRPTITLLFTPKDWVKARKAKRMYKLTDEEGPSYYDSLSDALDVIAGYYDYVMMRGCGQIMPDGLPVFNRPNVLTIDSINGAIDNFERRVVRWDAEIETGLTLSLDDEEEED